MEGKREQSDGEVPQQYRPIAAKIWDVSGSPEPPLMISFIKNSSYMPNLKNRDGVCFFLSYPPT